MDCCKQYALKTADPKYQAMTEKIRALYETQRGINTKQCLTMRMISNLQASLDVVRYKSFEFESTPEDVNKVLEERDETTEKLGTGPITTGQTRLRS